MKHIHEIQHQGLLWVNVTKQTEKELSYLRKRFGFGDADIQESLPPFQRPKIAKRSDYYFMVLHFPVFDRESRRLGFTEVDFFVNSSFIVTVHDNKLPTIDNFFDECEKDETKRAEYFNGTAVHVLFELLNRLLDAIFPILLHINEDINYVDRKLFSKVSAREMAGEILRLKTNIVTFRRTMQGHRTVIERLMLYGGRDLNLPAYQQYINSLREYLEEIWNMLESQKESIYAMHEASESTLSLKTNEVMKTLTVISVITFPLTLLVTIFAARAGGTPFIGNPFGFWIIFGLTLLGAGIMAFVFKKKGWM